MRSVGRGAHGCKAGVEIPSQRRPPTSPKVAQLIVSSEFTVIRPVAYASIRWALVLFYTHHRVLGALWL